VHPRKTAGADIQNGISVDQVADQAIGDQTRVASLEIGCDDSRTIGNCDSGYSCAYTNSLAWKGPATPLPPETNPRLVFERLFGSGSPGERRQNLKRRQAQQRSILDFVLDDAASLQRNAPGRDKAKLDEYLTSVREIEKRIEHAERFGETPDPSVDTPAGVPASFEEHIRLMYDMLLLAFQTDSTRVATFMLANAGSNKTFPSLGVTEGHHTLSHHAGDKAKQDKIKKIDKWYIEHFAAFLEKLNSIKEERGTLLDNSMIVYGGALSDGNRHNHDDLPVILAGKGGGTLASGRFLKMQGQPMSSLFLSMFDRMKVKAVQFGDAAKRAAL